MAENRFPEFGLSGKVAVVTGAGRGLGHAVSLALAKYGADLVLCSRTISELEKVKAEVEALGRKALVHPVDVTRIPDVRAMVDETVKSYGHVDILVNNAGINVPQPAEDVTEEAWDRVIDTNLKACFFVAQAVGRVMIRQRAGRIINVSSQTGTVAIPLRAAYCSSKGALNLLTKVLAIEWAKHNITVNAIAPTFLETPFTQQMFASGPFRDYVLGNIPLGRLGQPRDVVGAVIYLASDASSLVTGHVLAIDGGWTAQ